MKVRVLGRHVEPQNVMLISHVCQIALGVDAMFEARIVRARVMMEIVCRYRDTLDIMERSVDLGMKRKGQSNALCVRYGAIARSFAHANLGLCIGT